MTPIETIGAVAALGFHSAGIIATWRILTAPEGPHSDMYDYTKSPAPVTWETYALAFFWEFPAIALLVLCIWDWAEAHWVEFKRKRTTHPTNIDQMGGE